jgi:hypothetical protein
VSTLVEAVATATAALPRVYVTNAVPATPTYPYSAYSATFGRGDTYTLDSTHGVRWGRLVWQSFGKTLQAALDQNDRAVAALLDVRLAVTGYSLTPCRMELDPAIVRDPDDNGVVGVTTTLTFTATKES